MKDEYDYLHKEIQRHGRKEALEEKIEFNWFLLFSDLLLLFDF
jgi:hypothetical protein